MDPADAYIKSTIAACAMLAAATVYGAGASSKSGSLNILGFDNNIGLYASVNSDELNPNNAYAFIDLQDYNTGSRLVCSGDGSSINKALNVPSPAKQGSFYIETSQLNCYNYGIPLPAEIKINCVENGTYSDSNVSNGSSTDANKLKYTYHSNLKQNAADCTIMFDEEEFSSSNGSIAIIYYVYN